MARRAAAGDRHAYAALVRLYQRPLFGYLGRMGLSQGEAEEIAQEAFLRAWEHLARFDPTQATFSTWLYTFARRLALHLIESAERRYRQPPPAGVAGHDQAPVHAGLDPSDASPGPADTLQARQQRAWLQAAMHRLSTAERSLLALAYLHDLSLAEIARIEGLSEAAAKARLHRARQRLREALHALDPDHCSLRPASAAGTSATPPHETPAP